MACAAAVIVAVPSALAQAPSPPPVTEYGYDSMGNRTRMTQAPGSLGLLTTNGYDRLGRVISTTDPTGGLIRYGYDASNRVTQVIDPRQLHTTYGYNGLGAAASLQSPDSGSAVFTTDAAGNIVGRSDSRGASSVFTYDALNRITAAVHSMPGQSNLVHEWVYDLSGPGYGYGSGRLSSSAYPGGSTRYAYDAKGQLVAMEQVARLQDGRPGATLAVGFGYDGGGQLAQTRYPSGRELRIYVAGGLPYTVVLASGSTSTMLVSQIQHAPEPGTVGPRAWTWHYSNGTQRHERVLDSSGRIVRYPLGGALRDLHYDDADRIVGYTHVDRVTGVASAAAAALDQAFEYDANGRLTSVVSSQGQWDYSYDANGNRSSQRYQGSTRGVQVDAASNRVLALDNPVRSFGHDAAGNTVLDVQGTRTLQAAYDATGRMSWVRRSGGEGDSLSYYAYNTLGQRVLKQTDGPAGAIARAFVHDPRGRLLGEYDAASGAPLREYLWLGQTPLAFIAYDKASAADPTPIFYIHSDHLDTPRVALDRSGAQRWSWVAEPFGNSHPVSNPSGLGELVLNLRMPGQYHDEESGLVHNGFRDYEPGMGRFTQSDPIGLEGGINTYAYVEGNPLSYSDPLGLDRWGDQPGFRWGTKPGVPLPDGDDSRLYVFSMCVQACYGEPIVITSTNEPYKGHGSGTAHGDSAAIDLRYSAMSNPDKALCCAAQCGARYGLDEMKNPSKHSSAPHFHLELPHPRNKNWSRGNLPAGECSKC